MNIEDKILDAARIHAHLKENFDLEDELYYNSTGMNAYKSFQAGIKSEVAKEYWQKGMYSEEEVFKLLEKIIYTYHNWQHSEYRWDLAKWFVQNKKK